MMRTLKDLISEGEHVQQDFKYEISSVSKIAHSLSAFANTQGGRLLIGVRDNGRIAGVRSEEEIYMIDAAATMYCYPPITCHLETVLEDNHTIVIATIEESAEKPVRAKETDGKKTAYVRIKDENIIASPVHLAYWRKQQHDDGSYLTMTDKQRIILKLFEEYPNGLTLNQFYKKAGIKRDKAIKLLADYIRFELVQIDFRDHTFYFVGC